jgi:Rrf2 family protein
MHTQTSDYALRAMVILAATPDRLVPTPALADQTLVPATYLAKVLQQLGAAGLITGRRGVGGGYRLAKPAAKITMLEVVAAVSPAQRLAIGPPPEPPRPAPLKALDRRTAEANAAATAVYRRTTLADIVAEGGAEARVAQ